MFIAIIAFLLSLTLTLGLIRLMRGVQLGQHIRQYGPDIHLHKQGTPTMGGLAFLVSTGAFLTLDLHFTFASWFVVAALFSFAAVGFIDDLMKFSRRGSLGLKARYKFLFQIIGVFGLFFLLSQNPAHIVFVPGLNMSFNVAGVPLLIWLFLVFSGTTNAFNLTDGLDGLASGIGLIALLPLGFIAAWQGQMDLVALIVIFSASVLAFLTFNRYPARIFMGDTGSFAIGGFVAAVAFSMGLELYLLLFAIIPVLETFSVVLQLIYFRFTQKRIFKIAPFHHHFEAAKGVDYPYLLPAIEWPETKITLNFWGVATLSSLLGLSLYLLGI